MFVDVKLACCRVRAQADFSHVDSETVTAHRHTQFKPFGQRFDATERPMLCACLVRCAPAPSGHVAAKPRLQFIQGARQGQIDVVLAGLDNGRCFSVIAPCAVVAAEHTFQGINPSSAHGFIPQRGAQIVGQHGGAQVAHPGPKDKWFGLVGPHVAVKGREQRPGLFCQRVCRIGFAQPRQHPHGSQRLHIRLHDGQVVDAVFGPAAQHLLNAFLSKRQRPITANEVRIVGRMNALVGRCDVAALGVELPRCFVQRHPARPVITGVPTRRRRQTMQVVFGLAHRHSAG